MLTREQLQRMNKKNLPLHLLEQDYIQSLFLQELYNVNDDLVFKGGTYLKHAHGLDRFSEDLDFTLIQHFDISNTLTDISSGLSSYGVEAELDRMKDDELSFNTRLRYRGPLFDGSRRSMGSVAIEISKRNDIFVEPEWIRLFFDYPDIRVVNVLGMIREEVLSEKLRALSMRDKGRDLYDVWFLLKQGVVPDEKLFRRKMRIVNLDPDLNITVTDTEWDRDLSILLFSPPDHGKVLDFVLGKLKENGFEIP